MPRVVFEKKGGVLRVSLNRPAALNAINSALLQELESGIKEHISDTHIKVLLLYGRQGCFAAGADIKELAALDGEGIRRFHRLRENTFSLLENFPSPTVALIERYALGTGLELALCCDFRIAGEDAQMGVPSAKLGIVESFEYISRVVRAVGPFHAKKLILTGERIDARTAFTIGLVEEVTPPDRLFDRADSLISDLSKNSSYSMRQSKKVIDKCAQDPYLRHVADTAIPMVDSFKSSDFKEGSKAFLEKRKANFE